MMETNTTTASQAVENKIDGWALAMGIFLIVGGTFAIMSPVISTFMTELILGWFLIFGGAMQFIGAIVDRKNNNVWLGMAMGVLALVLGIIIITNVLAAIISITMLLGILFLVDGVSKSIRAVIERPIHWGWMLTSGLISIVLAVLILTKLLLSSVMLLGMLIGVYMLFAGIELVIMYYATKK